jgi:hypothetical protein
MLTGGSNIPGGRRNKWRRRVLGPCSGNQGRRRNGPGGTWWDRVYNRIVVEGKDFVQDTQDGVGDEFELIPDSEETEEGVEGSSMFHSNDEIVTETEVQEVGPDTELQHFTLKMEGQQSVTETKVKQIVRETKAQQLGRG